MMLCQLNELVNLVLAEEDIIDGAASVTTWVTTSRLDFKAWDHYPGGLDEGSRLVNVRRVAEYVQCWLDGDWPRAFCPLLLDNRP